MQCIPGTAKGHGARQQIEQCHVELQRPRIQKDEEVVSAAVSLIHEWVNPFAEKQELISISTAEAAP